jgi:predicted RNase H-like nuclease (RuvC/YqgF family)
MKPVTPASAGFPKVDGETQKSRDATRRKILQDELDTEQKLLEEARNNLDEASPEVFKGKDGKTYRNVASYEEKVKPLQEQVDLHTRNIEALKTEMSKLPK